MNKRDFKSLIDINTQEFKRIIQQAIEYKELDKKHSVPRKYVNRTLAMIFKKNSTRTRVSFETAMYKLGGHAIFLSESTTQLNRGEVEKSFEIAESFIKSKPILFLLEKTFNLR